MSSNQGLFPPLFQRTLFCGLLLTLGTIGGVGFDVDVAMAKDGTPANDRVRPNIVFCMADDWSWPHAGIFGDSVVKTPNFDRIANEGVLFENAFVSTPSCTPSRLSQFHRAPRIMPDKGDYMGLSMVTDHYHYVEWRNWDDTTKQVGELAATELYDLHTDPDENANIANSPNGKKASVILAKRLHDGWQAALPGQ